MRSLLVLLMLAVFLQTSCAKFKTKKLKYKVSAVYDSSGAELNTIVVTVDKAGGGDGGVTISIDSLPPDFSASIDNSYSFPPFTAKVKFVSDRAEKTVAMWKEYTVTINTVSDDGIKGSFPVKFTYLPPNAAKAFDGHTFYLQAACSAGGTTDEPIDVYSYGENQITLSNFYNIGIYSWDVPATLDAKTHTITIGPYTDNYNTFRGTGTFYPMGDSVGCNISYSRSTVSSFDSCTGTFIQWY